MCVCVCDDGADRDCIRRAQSGSAGAAGCAKVDGPRGKEIDAAGPMFTVRRESGPSPQFQVDAVGAAIVGGHEGGEGTSKGDVTTDILRMAMASGGVNGRLQAPTRGACRQIRCAKRAAPHPPEGSGP